MDESKVPSEREMDDQLLHRYAVIKHVRDVLLAKRRRGNDLHPSMPRQLQRLKEVEAEYKHLYPTARKIIDNRTMEQVKKMLSYAVKKRHKECEPTSAESAQLEVLLRELLFCRMKPNV